MKKVKVVLTAGAAGTVTAAVPVTVGKKPLTPVAVTAVSTSAVSSVWVINQAAGGAADAVSMSRGTALLVGSLSANIPAVMVVVPEVAHVIGGEVFTLSATFSAAGTMIAALEFEDSLLTELDVLRDRAA
jgi:hypothetical protein